MNNIEWKENAVCCVNGKQWFESDGTGMLWSSGEVVSCKLLTERHQDFQLNEPKQGDYLPKSELDTEQKYNDAVEVFGLFGFEPLFTSYHDCSPANTLYFINEDCIFIGGCRSNVNPKREFTYNQLMAIGKLKRLMNERKDEESTIQDSFNADPNPNKSKQAYEILKSLDYDYDLVKQCWYRKEWV